MSSIEHALFNMPSDEYNKVELPALEQLRSLGWEHVEGTDLSPNESDERSSFKDAVLEKRLAASIQRINPWINQENLNRVVRDLTKTPYTDLSQANKSIWEMITKNTFETQDIGKGNKGQTIKIIDFENPENNDFLCANQFTFEGASKSIKPDIVLFVNGLPLAVIECKSPFLTSPMKAGIEQLLRYKNSEHERLFYYNQMMISTYGLEARVGTITSQPEHYLAWKDPYPLSIEKFGIKEGAKEGSQKVLIAGMLNKTNFLDLIQNFIVFEPEHGKELKKLARYQQFRAVHKTIKRVKENKKLKDKGGIIWHTQGSGKSLTMVFLTIKMRRDEELRKYKLVFLTDRTQLDNQLTKIFINTEAETPLPAKSAKHLKELLASDSSSLITTTLQKFQEDWEDSEYGGSKNPPTLNESDKIIILTDEAHRTQYGTLGAALNAALPNAPKIAFTGTPLIKSQKTKQEFGSYIDTYTIDQSEKDGATVRIIYSGHEAEVKVTGDSLDDLFNEYFADKSAEEKAEIKKKYGTDKAVLDSPKRICEICIDILKHYEETIKPNGFKAMIATSSRQAAITYKEELNKLGAPESAVIISGTNNDEEHFLQYTDSKKHKAQIDDFKKPLGTGEGQSPLSFIIVTDMLLTGFNAPIAQAMYLDKKLTEHSLLQAIARVNRTAENKSCGYIIDYYGLSDYLTEAWEMFSSEDVAGALNDLKEEIPRLKNAHTRVMQNFKGVDLDDLDECIYALRDELKRQTFQSDFHRFSKQLDIVLPDQAAAPFLTDLKILGKISHAARNAYRDDQLDISGAGEKVRQLIEEHLYSIGIDVKIPPVDLFAADFKEKLGQHKSSRAKAIELENGIREHIKIKIDEDPEYYKDLSKRLDEIIQAHGERWDELAQLLLEFSDTIQEGISTKAQSLGLSETESAFFNILKAEFINLLGDENIDQYQDKMKIVVKSLIQKVSEARQIIDFDEKWDEQSKVRKEIRHIIIEHLGESLAENSTIDALMNLAKVRFEWI